MPAQISKQKFAILGGKSSGIYNHFVGILLDKERRLQPTLHFDCFSGVSGDMTLAALIDLAVPAPLISTALDSLQLPGKLFVQKTKRCGLSATQITVDTPKEHRHRHLSHIVKIIDQGSLTPGAKELAVKMFTRLAEAEALCYGTTIEKVHFHEVGAVDSIFDLVGVAVGIDFLRPGRITCAPVPTGSGWVECEHGKMPVPAPAVAQLLKGIPTATSGVTMELTTPTGAAIIASLATEFVIEPALTIDRIGLGAGSRDLPSQPNVLRLLLGQPSSDRKSTLGVDFTWLLQTNVDDASGEIIGYCFERLFAAGALDVFTQPIQMKKNRPGTMISVMCDDGTVESMESILFQETGTFGIRKQRLQRTVLDRTAVTVDTPWGPVSGKRGWWNNVAIFAPEYEACAAIARERSLPLAEVFNTVRLNYSQSKKSQNQ